MEVRHVGKKRAMKSSILFLTMLVAILAAAACGGTATPTATPSAPTATPTIAATPTPPMSPAATATPTVTPPPTRTPTSEQMPVFEPAVCRFEIPSDVSGRFPFGVRVECGYVTVPEDRSQPSGPTIRLHVARFRSTSLSPAPDPIVSLEGGPGGHALEPLPLIFDIGVAPFLASRDFIIFDQRGTGYSEPALDCPELLQLSLETLDDDLSVEDSVALSVAVLSECRDRLVGEGVNLAAYTSAENAADLSDIRRALGIDEWNLYGTSYGTRLALTAMRDFPEGIRSVILDSSFPLEVDLLSSIVPNADRAFTTLFDGCKAIQRCDAAYPGLETTFFELVDLLDEAPTSTTITNALTGESFDALITGHGLIDFLFKSLYATEAIPLLPQIIFDVRDGNFDKLALIMGLFLANDEFFSAGMYYSVQCGEEFRFSSREDVAASAGPYPHLQVLLMRVPHSRCVRPGARRRQMP